MASRPRAAADAGPSIRTADLIEGLGKGLRVIEAFDESHPQLGASEVAERAEITRTAARRYLLSLVHFGYAATDGRKFWLVPRVLRLGQSYLESARLPRLAQPFIHRAAAQVGHTVNVSILDGHDMVYVARSPSPRWVTIGYAVGIRVPAHVVTPGYVVLAQLDDGQLDAWIAKHEFASFTPQTVSKRAVFRSHVHQARTLGHWHTESQLDPGLGGAAVALIDRRGTCVGAIGTTVPISAYPSAERMLEAVLPALRDAAQGLRDIL